MRRSLVTALFLAALPLCGCDRSSASKETKAQKTEAPMPVTVTPVRAQKVARTLEFVGTLYANEEVTVSSEVDGRIASLAADLGDRVARGQTLAKIDDAEFRFAIQQTESNLKENLARLGLEKTPPKDFDVTQTSLVQRAKADADDTERGLARTKTLYERQLIAAQDYDTAQMRAKMAGANYKSSMEEARASLAAASAKEAQLETARKKLRDTAITAPLAGSISKRSASAGEYVKVAAPLFTIVQDNPLKLRGMIPERFAPEIHTDQAVDIRVDSFPDATFKGRLTRISPSSEVTSRSFLVEGVVENPDRRLKPGFFAHAVVTTRVDPNALTVPQQAIVSFAGVSKVFVVVREPHDPEGNRGAENNVARERIIQTGVRVGTNEVEVTGLKPGELVVISGLTRLTNGAVVKVSGPVMPREGETQQP
jgi:membrane fusion protein (multidrug efflux system)